MKEAFNRHREQYGRTYSNTTIIVLLLNALLGTNMDEKLGAIGLQRIQDPVTVTVTNDVERVVVEQVVEYVTNDVSVASTIEIEGHLFDAMKDLDAAEDLVADLEEDNQSLMEAVDLLFVKASAQESLLNDIDKILERGDERANDRFKEDFRISETEMFNLNSRFDDVIALPME